MKYLSSALFQRLRALPPVGGRWRGALFLPFFFLCSCTEDDFLEGSGKTPLVVVSNLTTTSPVSRATNGEWETGDVLIARIKHVTTTGSHPSLVYADDVSGSGVGPTTAYFKVSALTEGHKEEADNHTEHTASSTLQVIDSEGNATGLYWDDFSNSAASVTDLRTENHALMAHYAVGYNGGAPTTVLDEQTGILGWTVAQDQSAGFKTSDLLFAPQQKPVAYTHGSSSGINGRDRVITLPFSHAMSKVTVAIKLEEGYSNDDDNFASTTVVLDKMYTVATVTAPEAKVQPVPGTENANVRDITMRPIANEYGDMKANLHKSFSALIAPTVMKDGQLLAHINNINGNNYTLTLSDAVLQTATSPAQPWSSQLAAHDATYVTPASPAEYTAENGGLTKPGVHYLITVSIRKQDIKVQATLQDWAAVDAHGIGVIQFATDIKGFVTDPKVGDTGIAAHTAAFDLYTKASTAGDEAYGAAATKVTWNVEQYSWEYTPPVYWQNKDDELHFRALSGATPDAPETQENESLTMQNGLDVLWGTTAKHTVTQMDDSQRTYNEGDPIYPRTKDVPLIFRHAMSKITVNLVDALAGSTVPGAKLSLQGATIQLTHLSTGGAMALHTGTITPSAVAAKMLSEDTENHRYGFYAANDASATGDKANTQLLNYVVTPQTIDNASHCIITLADGTTYRLQLNSCAPQTGTDSEGHPIYGSPITSWIAGKHYTYTITLSKEAISVRAMVKDWDDANGSGNATLEWD